MSPSPSLDLLRAHPIFVVTDLLSGHVGVRRDLIQLVEFLSLAAGKMVIPVNLDLFTEQLAPDLFIANRILDLLPENVARIDTYKQFVAQEEGDFGNLAAILIRGNHPYLYRNFTEYTARLVGAHAHCPSLWRISGDVPAIAAAPPTLRLMTLQASRDLTGFGHAYATFTNTPEGERLKALLSKLPKQPAYPCPFRNQYQDALRSEEMLIFERFLRVFAAIRSSLDIRPTPSETILSQDYDALRAMLASLPLTPVDRRLSPSAIATADAVYAEVTKPTYQLALPDRSAEGHRWFTRQDARGWTGFGYTTIKKQLQELEDDGLLISTVAENNRERGRQIHYRFAPGRGPPFGWRNPFSSLPDLKNQG